jgi:hypothetical protein
VSALAFGLAAYLVARLGTYPTISVAAWLPWIMWAALGILSTGRIRDAGLTALFAALILLAGHAQTAWYCLLLVGVFGMWWEVRTGEFSLQTRLVRLLGAGAAILLGAGVAALQLAGTAELLGQSQRSDGAEYYFAMNYSYPPARALNLIAPNVFGTPADGSYLTEGAFFEDAVYIGLIPVFSAFAAVIAWLRRLRSDTKREPSPLMVVPFALLLVVVGFVLALGRYTPIFPFLYENMPTFDAFQAPARWHLWTVFGLSLLAGIGAGVWGRDRRTKQIARWGIVIGLGMIVAGVAGVIGLTNAGAGVGLLVRAAISTGILVALVGLVTLRQPQENAAKSNRWVSLVLVVIAADLVWAGWGLNPTVPRGFYAPTEPPPINGRIYWSAETERTVRYDEFFRFRDYRVAEDRWRDVRESGLTSLNLLDGVSSFNNFDPLLIGHYLSYTQLLDQGENSDFLLRMAGIEAVYTDAGTYTTLDNVQRAWLVDAICWHETQTELISALSDPDWGAECSTHMLGDLGLETSSGENVGQVLDIRDSGNRVEIDIETARQGWFVLADTDYPGWKAYINGVETSIYRANLAFRAVQVEAGTQTVEFVYQPAWGLPALFISLVCAVLMIVLIRVKTPKVS